MSQSVNKPSLTGGANLVVNKAAEDFLEDLAKSFQIPDSRYEEAEQRYKSVANWLKRPESTLKSANPDVYSQGSFALGTVVKPVSEDEDYDIDMVCAFEIDRAKISQEQIKNALKHELAGYAKKYSMEEPEPHRRCVRLNYADGAQFHLDATPATPDGARQRLLLDAGGLNSEWIDLAVAITDEKHFAFKVPTHDWPHSKSPWFHMFKAGLLLILAALAGGWLFKINISGLVQLEFDTSQGGYGFLIIAGFLLGSILILIGSIGMIWQQFNDHQSLSRKKVIVLEQRGLRDTSGTPLDQAIPNTIRGRRELILNDIRQRIRDGIVTDPQAALERINPLALEIENKRNGLDRKDITIAYGGLMPVPFSFLTGMLLDDEDSILMMDWDRDQGRWRSLDGDDDGDRFEVSGLDQLPQNASEIVLAVSVSYRANVQAIEQTLPGFPLVQLILPNGNPACHWSEEKQRELAKKFRDTVIALNNVGMRRIHLFIAAQNSFVCRLGRTYDKRNMPSVVVYQYEQSSTPPYPWGVLMPTHGIVSASVLRT